MRILRLKVFRTSFRLLILVLLMSLLVQIVPVAAQETAPEGTENQPARQQTSEATFNNVSNNEMDAVQEDPVVTFPDAGLEAAIRETIKKQDGDIYQSDLDSIQQLYAYYYNIADLSGIENCHNLQLLHLSCNQIDNISPLAELSNLYYLELTNNKVKIEGMPLLANLSTLFLEYNQIDNLTGMPELPKLACLYLDNNQISSLTGMPELPELKYLCLGNNQISSLTGIPELPELTYLDVGNNKINSLAGMPVLPKMEELELSGNQIDNLTGMPELPELKTLNLNNNHVNRLAGMPVLTNLVILGLRNNQISSLTGMPKLPELYHLDLGYNPIDNLTGMPELSKLKYLILEYNPIKSLTGMPVLVNLFMLDLDDNQINSLIGMPELPELTYLYLNNNRISSLTGIPELLKLRILFLENNQISDLNGLESQLKLDLLLLSNNQIEDISPLVANSGLGNGDDIDLTYNDLNISAGSTDMVNIQTLLSRGAEVKYEPQSNPVITFPDAGLEAAIRNAIKKPAGDIFQSYLDSIEVLYADGYNISNLSGIENCHNLHSLGLSGNQIDNISILAELNLKGLTLNNNRISSLTGIPELPELTSLDIRNNNINSLAGMPVLTNLNILDLSNNPIDNLSGMPELPWLKTLYLNNNHINRLAGMPVLTNLITLYLSNNQIDNLSGMPELPWLKRLYLNNNQITSLNGMPDLPELKSLELSNNQINSLSEIPANLTSLDLSNNRISDLNRLESFLELRDLNLSNNQISDIFLLVANSGINNGDHIDLTYNYLDISPGSSDRVDIQTLLDRGVEAKYVPQNIQNNAPVVNLGEDVSIVEGSTFTSSGSFSDNDSSAWTAKVNYGDVSEDFDLTLTEKSFNLSHVFKTAGVYTVTVTVTDDQGDSGTESLMVTVTENILLGTLSGKAVISGTETAIANVPIYVSDLSNYFGTVAVTSDNGTYTVNVPAGNNYVVQARPQDHGLSYADQWYNGASSLDNATKVSVTTGNNTQNINFSLVPMGSISGKAVSSGTETGIGNVPIYITDSLTGDEYETTTSGSGEYFLDVPAGQHYLVHAVPADNGLAYLEQWYNGASGKDGATEVIVIIGNTTTGIDFSLVQKLSIAISGEVHDGEVKITYKPVTLILTETTGTYTWTWKGEGGSATPSGLRLKANKDTLSAVISGKPTKEGTYSFKVTATDKKDKTKTYSRSYEIKVIPSLAITTEKVVKGEIGEEYSLKMNASGGKEPYSWTISKGELPPGLHLSNITVTEEGASGEEVYIAGTPSAAGSYKFTVQVTDGQEGVVSKALTIRVYDELRINEISLLGCDVGVTCKTTTLKASGGIKPYSWKVVEGDLPEGIELNEKGVIKGKAAAGTSGEYNIMVQVSDDIEGTAEKEFTLKVNDPLEISVEPEIADNVTVGDNNSYTFTASGGSRTGYKWLKTGSLPKGLKLVTNKEEPGTCIITGTYTKAGKYQFTLKLTDSLKGQGTYTVMINVK